MLSHPGFRSVSRLCILVIVQHAHGDIVFGFRVCCRHGFYSVVLTAMRCAWAMRVSRGHRETVAWASSLHCEYAGAHPTWSLLCAHATPTRHSSGSRQPECHTCRSTRCASDPGLTRRSVAWVSRRCPLGVDRVRFGQVTDPNHSADILHVVYLHKICKRA